MAGKVQFWTDEMNKKASEMWKAKYSNKQIADAIGVTYSALGQHAFNNRDKFPSRAKSGIKSDDANKIKLALDLWNEDTKISEICKELGVTHATFMRMRNKNKEKFSERQISKNSLIVSNVYTKEGYVRRLRKGEAYRIKNTKNEFLHLGGHAYVRNIKYAYRGNLVQACNMVKLLTEKCYIVQLD